MDEPWVLMIPAMDNLHLQIRSVLRLVAAQREENASAVSIQRTALLFVRLCEPLLQRGGVIALGTDGLGP